jgi:glutathione S-transferase
MSDYRLHVFDYNYSSWSMRAGIIMRATGAPFDEVRVNLDDGGKQRTKELSPSGLLPMLEHGTLKVWDSLAIGEYMAEQFPALALWPEDPKVRAVARAASCEMHAGFSAIRQLMTMNIRAHFPGFPRPIAVDQEVSRVKQLWTMLRKEHGSQGDFLCGRFGIVDAMFAPVVTRFRTYDVKLEGACAAYSEAMLAQPAVSGWLKEAAKDTYRVPHYDYVVG